MLSMLLGAGNWEWAYSHGGASMEMVWDIATDNQNNIYITGSYTDHLQVGPLSLTGVGESDVFVAKFSPNGDPIWLRGFGSAVDDSGIALALDETGNCYVTGYKTGVINIQGTEIPHLGLWDIFLVKYDPNGNMLFAKNIGGESNDIGYGISYAAGRIFITGWFGATMTFENGLNITTYGGSDIYIAAVDLNGNALWVKKAGMEGVDYGFSVSADALGNAYITGIAGANSQFESYVLPGDGVFIAKYNPDGLFLWAQGADNVSVNEISVNANQGVITGRHFGNAVFGSYLIPDVNGSDDIYIAGFDLDSGDWTGATGCGGFGSDRGRACFAGTYPVYTGSFSETADLFGLPNQISHGAFDIYIFANDNVNPDNTELVAVAGGANDDIATAIFQTPEQDILITGWHSGITNFGNIQIDSGLDSNANFFLAKYSLADVSLADELNPSAMSSMKIFPNPARNLINFIYNTKSDANVLVTIYNVKGQRVAKLKQGYQTSGEHSLQWNGNDLSGKILPTGVYIVKLQVSDEIISSKIVIK